MGPTASGKTELALNLAEQYPFEIVSVDSAMVYRGMDIGTAKPTREERQRVKHHLIDICDPQDIYSAGQFRRDALIKIEEIFASGKVPLLVGGTMLYFRVLAHGISELPKSSKEIRSKVQMRLVQFGVEHLYQELAKIDPQTAKKLHATDKQRIVRALEVYEASGKKLSELQLISKPQSLPYEIVNIAISPRDIAQIRHKIKERLNKMLKLGFIDEVRKLHARRDLNSDLPSIRTVGYRQVWQYLSGEISYDIMLELILIKTGHLAKRQLTWLKSWGDLNWFESGDQFLLQRILDLIMV